ncbi:Nn.00g114680.m01.CDS01 [Neocucurbitaria sp. VM-36]
MRSLIPLVFIATFVTARPQPVNLANSLPRIQAQPLRRANQIIPVIVGGPQDTFVPNSVVAAVGDVVQFQFSNGNHTVTQSTPDTACTPMDGGVHSGHIPFVDGQTEVGTFNMPVTSTDPMFLYCATGPHCQEGQVMVINAANAQQVADYTKLSQQTQSSTDGTDVVGGTAGKISLDTAAFVPAPPEDAAAAPPPPPAAEAPPAETPAAETPAAETPAAETPAAETPAAETPAAETPAAETPAAETPAAA